MIYTLKNIGAHAAGKMYGAVLGTFSLLMVIPLGLYSLFVEPSAYYLIAMVLVPGIYYILGYIGGGLIAVIYNFVARRVGGIEIELKEKV